MGGDKWNKSMTSVVGICKKPMIENLDVVVSFRSTHNSNRYHRRFGHNSTTCTNHYDSRVDKFSKVKNMFGNIHPVELLLRDYVSKIMDEIVPTLLTLIVSS